MFLSTSSLRRPGAILTLVAAAAAIAAPTTLANHRDVGTKTASQKVRAPTAAPDAVERYVRSRPQTVPNDQCDSVCRYLANHGQGIRLTTDTLGGDGVAPLPAIAPANGSSWSGAALAATTASGTLVVLLAGTLLVLRRRRSLAA